MRTVFIATFSLLAAAAATAQVEEIYSRHIRIFRPRGDLPRLLIRQSPPTGSGWKRVEREELGLHLSAPADASVDLMAAENRILQVTLAGSKAVPPPVLRVDRFVPGADDPTEVDAEYAESYAAEYPKAAFNGKFNVTDSGLVTRDRKVNFAMVAGSYATGAVETFRIQWAYLSKGQQLFVTFDCAAREWPRYSGPVSQMLLSLELDRRKEKPAAK
ncbi:MAG: hypothetical protein K0Q72_5325 [Armatimonadetes bacterium]|nr:hypothetical protein [Armatimonadota bacterium]